MSGAVRRDEVLRGQVGPRSGMVVRTTAMWRSVARAVGFGLLAASAGIAMQARAATPTTPAATAAPTTLATVTLLDGDATLLRESQKLDLAAGVRLSAGDIVTSGDRARLVRLEFPDGGLLDLGPSTRLLLSPKFMPDKPAPGVPAPLVYVLDGWIKWGRSGAATAAPGAASPTAQAIAAPRILLSDVTRQTVMRIEPPAVGAGSTPRVFVFAESGDAVVRTRTGPQAQALPLHSGEFFVDGADEKPQVRKRPDPLFTGFAQGIPPTFTDSLPSRAALYKDRPVDARPAGAVSYADVQGWLHAEPGLRTAFMARWKGRLADAEFRRSMVAGVAQHPEWDRLLFPEKYRPRPVVVPASAPRAASAPVPVR